MSRWLFALCLLLTTIVPRLARAATYWVAATGTPGDGSSAKPFLRIQDAVDRAEPGDTIYLHGGTYREQQITVSKKGAADKPIVIASAPGEKAMIKGSRVVTGWTPHLGKIWRKTAWTVNAQQVFANELPLEQIGIPSAFFKDKAADGSITYFPKGTGLLDMTEGSFYWDPASKTLYVWLPKGADPNAAAMEVSVTPRLVTMTASSAYVVLRDLAFRHSNGSADSQMSAAIELGPFARVERCDVQWTDFAGIAMGYKHEGAAVVDSIVSHNGNSGINASGSKNVLIRGNEVAYNTWRPFNPLWHGGGMKIVAYANGTVENNRVHHNGGVGVWFDWCSTTGLNVVRNNWIYDNHNKGAGVMFEGSKHLVMYNNFISGGDRRGIYVSASDDVAIYQNTVVGIGGFAALDVSGMPRDQKTLTDIVVLNNIFADSTAEHDAFVLQENGTDIKNIRVDYNLFYRGGSPLRVRYGQDSRGGYKGTTFATVADFAKSSPHCKNCIDVDPQLAMVAAIPHGLDAKSPAIDFGTEVPVMTDYFGTARPVGPRRDLGAYEWRSTPPEVDAGPVIEEDSGVVPAVDSGAVDAPVVVDAAPPAAAPEEAVARCACATAQRSSSFPFALAILALLGLRKRAA
jgi:hypothetical protein